MRLPLVAASRNWLCQGQRFAERGLLEHSEVDVVVAILTMTRERAGQVDFSEACYLAYQRLFVQANSPVQEPQDFADKAVAVVKSSTSCRETRSRVADLRATRLGSRPFGLGLPQPPP